MEQIIGIIFSDYAILCATFLATFILVLTLLPDESRILTEKRLGVDLGKRTYKFALIKYASFAFPLIKPWVMSLNLPKYKEKIKNKILVGNISEEIDPDGFICFKVVMTIVFIAVAFYYYGSSSDSLPIVKIIFIGIVGFFLPDLWLASLISTRHKQIRKALPYVMDLLTLSVEAGLDFVASIVRIAEKAKPSPLVDELRIYLKEVKLGTTRSDGLANLSGRVQLSELSAFTTVLIQADQLGASIGPVLRAQADLLRSQRFQRAERLGAQASQKILFPLIFFILPTIAIVIFAPMILEHAEKIEGFIGALLSSFF